VFIYGEQAVGSQDNGRRGAKIVKVGERSGLGGELPNWQGKLRGLAAGGLRRHAGLAAARRVGGGTPGWRRLAGLAAAGRVGGGWPGWRRLAGLAPARRFRWL